MTFVVTGAGGQLGSVLLHELVTSGRPALGLVSTAGPRPATGHSMPVELTELGSLDAVRFDHETVLIHAAAVSSIASSHAERERTFRVNVEATQRLAQRASGAKARFVYVSTDMVFDGESPPYAEDAIPRPLSAYGRSKLEGERAARRFPGALILRLPLLYGLPRVERPTTFLAQMRDLLEGKPLGLFFDEYRTPLSLGDAARAIVRAIDLGAAGTLHLAGPERLSRLEMGRELARALGLEHPNIVSRSRLSAGGPEPRPRDLSLDGRAYERLSGAPAGEPMRLALPRMLAERS